MALRIKLPAKTLDIDVLSEPAQRRVTKRRLTINSDDEDEQNHSGNESPQSTRETSKRPRMRRSHTAESYGDEFDDMNTDQRTSPPPHPRASSSTIRKTSSLRRKAQPDDLSSTKKRVEGSEDDYSDEDVDISITMEEEEESYAEKRRGNKRAGRAKSSKAIVGGTKPSRGKSKQNLAESDERKANRSLDATSATGTKRSRPRLADESVVDVVGDDHDSVLSKLESPAQPKEATPPPPPAKKRKLPTIKKNKLPGPTGPVTPITNLVKSALPPSQTTTADSTLLPTTSARKPAATAGNADFDLRNASVYAELFKTAGGSTPRSGLNRREKDEERRKELNKMRDEARAKRALEEVPAFDLQGQTEIIARFEEKLRNTQSSALYPNFLAAKWREQWEKERRKKRESEWAEVQVGDWNGTQVRGGTDERQKT